MGGTFVITLREGFEAAASAHGGKVVLDWTSWTDGTDGPQEPAGGEVD